MKTLERVSRRLLAIALALATLTAGATEWVRYASEPYGFSMQVPEGTTFEQKEWGNGWAGFDARVNDVRLYGLAKLGPRESDEAIETFALQLIGVPASAWTRVDQGRNRQGWMRYRSFQAMRGDKLVFGGYGVGAKGNYLLYLETTPADFKQNRSAYDKWYGSIRLH